MARLSGTPKAVTLNGTLFDSTADANFTISPDSINEGVATSGETMHKKTKQVPIVEGVTLAADSTDWELILDLQDKDVSFPMSFTKADGSVYRNTGKINAENHETETNTANLSLIPNGKWKPFIVG